MARNVLTKKILHLNPLAVFYFFCSTIVIVRGSILLALMFNHEPGIFVRGWHIHHFVFGFLFLILALDESRKNNFPNWLLEIFYGIGLGLIFDEFVFWTFGRFDYWSLSNLYAMFALSVLAGILAYVDATTYDINIHHKKIKRGKFSFKRDFAFPFLSFVGLLSIYFMLK